MKKIKDSALNVTGSGIFQMMDEVLIWINKPPTDLINSHWINFVSVTVNI